MRSLKRGTSRLKSDRLWAREPRGSHDDKEMISTANPKRRPGRWFKSAAILGVSTVVVLLLVHKMPLDKVSEAWQRLSVTILAGALLCQIFFVEMRTLRFGMMAGSLPDLHPLSRAYRWFGATALYSMTSAVFPGGMGELMLPVYLKPFGVNTGSSLGLAVGSRLFDIGWSIMLALLFGLWLIPAHGWIVVRMVLVLAALGIIAISALIRFVDPMRLNDRLRLPGWAGRILSTAQKARAVINRLSWTDFLVISGMTLSIKLASTLFYYLIARGMGYTPGFLHVAAAMMFFSLFMTVPIQSPGGFGTSEAWWTLGLRLVGVPLKEALILGIAFQILNLLYVCAIGSIFMLVRIWPRYGVLRKSGT